LAPAAQAKHTNQNNMTASQVRYSVMCSNMATTSPGTSRIAATTPPMTYLSESPVP
jgi:hypothetical protein